MMKKVAINGLGRIGRNVLKQLAKSNELQIAAVNDLASPLTLAHLIKYDSVFGIFDGKISADEKNIYINDKVIPVYSEKDPSALPWKNLDVDIVIESTGKFTKAEAAASHLKAGARKVIISAPATGDLKTIVLGVNDAILDGSETIISNASCTTNNAAPMIKILDQNFEIESAYITTVHSYTGDQNLHDAPHKDLRRARAAAHSIIPTTTGAAKAITDVFPHLKGRIGGAGIRVPVIDGSLTDITCLVKKRADVTTINNIFKAEAAGAMKGILEYTEDPIVSIDIVGNRHSCIFDSLLTSVIGNMIKVVGWYDNEMGYSTRLVELCQRVAF
jgi:glyceraldehyde 3-phosphate dehydrogenase